MVCGGQARSQSKQSAWRIWYFCIACQVSTIVERQASPYLLPTIVEMDAKSIIGSFVRRLREQKHLTQEELAARTGITYQYLSGLENGRENFSIGILESLGKALECPLPQLVDRK